MNVTIDIKILCSSGNRKGWVKLINDVDDNQKGGYALCGKFLQSGEEDVPAGSILASCEPCGSVKNGYKMIYFGLVKADGHVEWDESGYQSPNQSSSMRKRAKELLASTTEERQPVADLSEYDTEDLLSELQARGVI